MNEEDDVDIDIIWSEMKEDAQRLSRSEVDSMAKKVVELLLTADEEIEQCFIMEGDSAIIAHRGEDGLVILLDAEVRRVALISIEEENEEDDITKNKHLKLVD